jgi:DNA-binding response OmpR family regulator
MSAQPEDAPRGFVTMREYLRLQRRLEALEDRLAYQEIPASKTDGRALLFVEALALSPQRAELLACLADGRLRTLHALQRASGCISDISLKTQMFHLRRAIEAHGAPVSAIINAWGVGYQMTAEGHQWLRERVPEAFDNQQGASR